MRALTSTSFWVSASSRSGALMTRSRSSWNAWVWASRSRSARAAATTTRVSRSRRWAGVSGIASSSCWRTLNACCRVALAFSTARLNRSACCWPNSSTAKANSLVLVRTALSTSTTIDRDSSSRASRGTAANALGSVGSTRLAAATSASCRLCLRRRLHSSSSAITSRMIATMISSGTNENPLEPPPLPAPNRGKPVGGRDRRACPVAAVQRGLDLVAADVVDLGRGRTAGRRRRHLEGVRALLGRDRQDGVLIAQVAEAAGGVGPRRGGLGGEGVDEHHPEPHVAVAVERVDRLLHVRRADRRSARPRCR